MQMLTIFRKTLLETWRDRQLLLLYLTFPALMILMYYLAFGGATSSMAAYLTVLVDNRDQGPLGAQFVTALREAKFDGQPAFTIQEGLPDPTARTALDEGKAALRITIPADFSAALTRQQPQPARLELLGDPLTDTYLFARSFLDETTSAFADRQLHWTAARPSALEFLPNTGKMSDFQVGVPGVLIFGMTFGLITSALMLVREASSGTLQRLRLSGASALSILGGITLANLALALVQVPLSFVVALAFGFNSAGSLPLAVAITLVFSLGVTGVGFITAGFSRSEGEATGLGTGFMVPLVFLSGAIFPLPAVILFTLFGHPVQVYDVMPSTHAAVAMTRVLLYGDGLAAVAYELTALVLLSLILFGLGVWVYQARVLKNV